MHLLECKFYTYFTVDNKGMARNSDLNHSVRGKKLVNWPNKIDDDDVSSRV